MWTSMVYAQVCQKSPRWHDHFPLDSLGGNAGALHQHLSHNYYRNQHTGSFANDDTLMSGYSWSHPVVPGPRPALIPPKGNESAGTTCRCSLSSGSRSESVEAASVKVSLEIAL